MMEGRDHQGHRHYTKERRQARSKSGQTRDVSRHSEYFITDVNRQTKIILVLNNNKTT